MYKISDVCPLAFKTRDYEHENEGACYFQKFSTQDTILIQAIADQDTGPSFKLKNLVTNEETNISSTKIDVNERIKVFQAGVMPAEGIYIIKVGNLESCEFQVTSDANELADTIKIEYTHSSNLSAFDALFWNGESQISHTLRIEGGFKSQGLQPKLEAETYRTQSQEIRHLYAYPYLTETLTIGKASGVPPYYADLLNRILCLDTVLIDGQRYARSDRSTPSLTQVSENYCRYWITQDIEKVNTEIEGIGGLKQSGRQVTSTVTGVSFNLGDTIEDGAVLQYKSDDAAFVDTTILE